MPKDTNPSKPTTRRYSPDKKAAAVRMVRTLRAELGTDHGTVKRVATQLGYGTESVRSWVRQADIDEGHAAGVSTSETVKMKALEQDAGITVRRVLTDNGACYRSRAFADAFGRDIAHKRTRPDRPQTNGKVERYNRTMPEECA